MDPRPSTSDLVDQNFEAHIVVFLLRLSEAKPPELSKTLYLPIPEILICK